MRNEFNTFKMMSVSIALALTVGSAGVVAAQVAAGTPAIGETIAASGNTATFDTVETAQDGYLVIHRTENGVVVDGEAIGTAPLAAGLNDDVSVTVEEPLVPGATYVAQIYNDTNDNGIFEGDMNQAEVDAPARINGEQVFVAFIAG
jgi:hypothetical protein